MCVVYLIGKRIDSSTIYGYRTKHGTCPIFVTYHKKDAVDSSVDYGEHDT